MGGLICVPDDRVHYLGITRQDVGISCTCIFLGDS
jgi:hypothetical protein